MIGRIGPDDQVRRSQASSGARRTENADKLMPEIVAKRLVERRERAGFVVMKKPPTDGGAAIARGFARQRPLALGWREKKECSAYR